MAASQLDGLEDQGQLQDIQASLRLAAKRLADNTSPHHVDRPKRQGSAHHDTLHLSDRTEVQRSPAAEVGQSRATASDSYRTVRREDVSGLKNKTGGSAGPAWFDMPRSVITPELSRDIKILANRSVLDSHRHYKKDSTLAKIPQFSQYGTLIEGNTEFLSNRLSRRERAGTLAASIVAEDKSGKRIKSRFHNLQEGRISRSSSFRGSRGSRRFRGKR